MHETLTTLSFTEFGDHNYRWENNEHSLAKITSAPQEPLKSQNFSMVNSLNRTHGRRQRIKRLDVDKGNRRVFCFHFIVNKKSKILVRSSPGKVRVDYTIILVTHQRAYLNVSESSRD